MAPAPLLRNARCYLQVLIGLPNAARNIELHTCSSTISTSIAPQRRFENEYTGSRKRSLGKTNKYRETVEMRMNENKKGKERRKEI